MNLNTARRMALALMAQHGLTGWTFEWDRAKTRGGACHHSKHMITISQVYAQNATEAEMLNTMLHEIAHALVGSGHGHDAVWRRKALSIGCTGERCHSVEMPKGAWEGKCGKCGNVSSQHRAPLRVKACACGRVFKPEHVLVWHKNGRKVSPHGISTRYAAEYARMVRAYGDRLPV